MNKSYKYIDFTDREERNYFEEGVTDIIYFPVKTTPDFPTIIMEKINIMITDMLCTYGKENNAILDISELHVDARLENFIDQEYKHQNLLCIVITSNIDDEVWMEKNYNISTFDPLYPVFKEYFMIQLEIALFDYPNSSASN